MDNFPLTTTHRPPYGADMNITQEVTNAVLAANKCASVDHLRSVTGRSARTIIDKADASADLYYDADSGTVTYCGPNDPADVTAAYYAANGCAFDQEGN